MMQKDSERAKLAGYELSPWKDEWSTGQTKLKIRQLNLFGLPIFPYILLQGAFVAFLSRLLPSICR
jgi:hypothetical protein